MTLVLGNIGIPMAFMTLIPMVVLIIPVIVVEYVVSLRYVKGVTASERWKGITVANITTTFIGWPAAWVILVTLQLVTGGGGFQDLNSPIGEILAVTLYGAWLPPYSDGHLVWMVPVATLVLFIPFFFVSVYLERYSLRMRWKDAVRSDVNRFSWVGHVYSYLFLCAAFSALYLHQ